MNRMVDDLAVQRFKNAEWSKHITPRDCLHTVIAELEEEKIQSVVVICVNDENEHVTYFAGPHTARFRDLWRILQHECLRTIERMVT